VKSVGPETPVGTPCIYIGPSPTNPERVGTLVRIERHLSGDSFPRLWVSIVAGFEPDVVVRAADDQIAATQYRALIRFDGDDPDATTRETEKERETC
jgi:hypothetical protein